MKDSLLFPAVDLRDAMSFTTGGKIWHPGVAGQARFFHCQTPKNATLFGLVADAKKRFAR